MSHLGLKILYDMLNAREDIAAERGVLRRVPEVQLTHRHFSNRLARFDSIYRKTRKVQDRALYHAWRNREDKT